MTDPRKYIEQVLAANKERIEESIRSGERELAEGHSTSLDEIADDDSELDS